MDNDDDYNDDGDNDNDNDDDNDNNGNTWFFLKLYITPDIMAHVYNLSIWEDWAGACHSLSWVYVTEWISEQTGLEWDTV